jgi:N utilization substance protein B
LGLRRKARERAVQALYQLDARGGRPETAAAIEETLQGFWASFDPPEPEVRKLAEPLIRGVLERMEELDGIVESSSLHWRLDRMARVDRNILRLGVYELRFRPEVPTKVCLNEAIEVARKYGAEDSGAFINGVLDRVAESVRGPLKTEGAGEPAGPAEDD